MTILTFSRKPIVSKWQSIVFDLDDTLYPEEDYVLSGFQAVAAWAELKLGIPSTEGFKELQALYEAGIRGNTFDHWLTARGLGKQGLVTQLVLVYREHEPTLEPFPEVPALLASLRRICRLGLVSDGRLAVQQRKLAALQLAPFFDAIVFSDEWGSEAWKPNTKPFEEVLSRLEAAADLSVYVADNPAKDFLAARRAGLHSIRFRHRNGIYRALEPKTPEYAPHYEISDLNQLEQTLSDLEAKIAV